MTKSERTARFNTLSRIGCIVCRIQFQAYSEPVIHHITGITSSRRGLGGKADDFDTIPLCPRHHAHHGHGVSLHDGVKTWEAQFGTQAELLEITNEMIDVIA